MTEGEAQAWLRDVLNVSRETIERLDALRQIILAEAQHQNLISAATVDHFWARHIVDSAQLIRFVADAKPGAWLDLGTGAGFPGLVVAILSPGPMVLVESRRKRFEFLAQTAEALALSHVTVHGGRLENFATRIVSVISARAFAPLPKLLNAAVRFSRNETVWLLPRGRGARDELALTEQLWQGVFHVEPSVSDTESGIIVARGVKRQKEAR